MKRLVIILIIAIAAFAVWRYLTPSAQPTPATNTNAGSNTNAVMNANVNAAPNVNVNVPANANVPAMNVNTNAPVGELPKKITGANTGDFLDIIKATFESGERVVLTVADLKPIMDAETAARFKDQGPHFDGQCFNSFSLAPDHSVMIFGVGCEPGDLALPWVGVYDFATRTASLIDDKGGHQYVWVADSKSVTYNVFLGLSGMEEKHVAIKNADGSFTVTKAP